MKIKILFLKALLCILLVGFTENLIAQQQLSLYKGTWHHQDGNHMFIVSIWLEGDVHYGHYKMVEYNNGVIGNTIYNSYRDYGNGARHQYAIIANAISGDGLAGFIYDNTISNYIYTKRGDFAMKLLPQDPGCSPCITTASWKVDEITRGLKVGNEPPFSIPTDIVLTYVSGTVDLD